MLKVGCYHGKKYSERCIECELVSEREGVACAERRVTAGKERIKNLENELRWSNVEPLQDSRDWFYPGEGGMEVQ